MERYEITKTSSETLDPWVVHGYMSLTSTINLRSESIYHQGDRRTPGGPLTFLLSKKTIKAGKNGIMTINVPSSTSPSLKAW